MDIDIMRNGLSHLGFSTGWAANEIDGIVLWEHDSPMPSLEAIESAAEQWQAKQTAKSEIDAAATNAAIAHAKSLGFTDEMIAVMYPNLALAV